jgi:glutamate---cysteine ligase / carboxylate-amine ligase
MRPSYFNEIYDGAGTLRGHYEALRDVYRGLGEEGLAQRILRAGERLRELGATFPVDDGMGDHERLLPVDWMPRIIAADEWRNMSEGLLQRGKALNAWLRGVYGDGQDLVPEEIVRGSVFYRPHDLPSSSPPIHIYGPDVVHLASGAYVVLEDNVRVPSGVAYSEAIRRAGMETMPEVYETYRALEIYSYYDRLGETLELAAPEGVENPNVVVITRGGRDPAFFEHHRIAQACGLGLMTLADCAVSEGFVYARESGRKIDVIYRRFDEGYIDTDLPELERVYLEGNVALVNAPGVGVADDKAVFPYVPAMIETYLGETPILQNAPTYALTEEETRAEVLERLPEMVVKPREGYGAQGILVGPEAHSDDIDAARRNINRDPTRFVAQETLDFSTHLLRDGNEQSAEVFVDLRAFVLPAIDYLMPRGLTRVAQPGTRVVNSTAGGSSKDTLVLQD